MRNSAIIAICFAVLATPAFAGSKANTGNVYLQFARTGLGDLTEWVVRLKKWSVDDMSSCRNHVANQLMSVDGNSIKQSVLDQMAQLRDGTLPDNELFNAAESVVTIIHDQVGPEIINCAVQIKNGAGDRACAQELDNVRRTIVTNLWAVTKLRQAATSAVVANCNPKQQP